MDYKEISPSVLPPTSDVDSTDQLDEDKKLSDSLSVSTSMIYPETLSFGSIWGGVIIAPPPSMVIVIKKSRVN